MCVLFGGSGGQGGGGQSNHSKYILKYSIFDYDDDCEYNSDELRTDFAFCDMLLDSFVPLTETSTIQPARIC